MPFWSDPNVEPKLSFRWYATFGAGSNAIKTYALRTFQKPSFEVATSEYLNINDVGYRPGILSWNPIEITISDIEGAGENNTEKLVNIIRESGYQNTNPSRPQSAIEKTRAQTALGGDIRFTQIDAEGLPTEAWVLVSPFITNINFGQGNYSAEEIMTISLMLRYDYAIYESL
jgi:hypothetical protein